VSQLRGHPVSAEQRMRQPPRLAFELAQRLRQPTAQGQIIKVAESQAVLFPEQVERRIGVCGHRYEHLAVARIWRARARRCPG
jgi:hypothetical protein